MISRPFFTDGRYVHRVISFDPVDQYFAYQQSTGEFSLGYNELVHEAEEATNHYGIDHFNLVLCTGYSGFGADYINNPAADHIVGKGPIPRGRWGTGPAVNHPRLGPCAIPLNPWEGECDPKGRSGFYIHGDNPKGNKTASSGCIILPRPIRDFIASRKVVSVYVSE